MYVFLCSTLLLSPKLAPVRLGRYLGYNPILKPACLRDRDQAARRGFSLVLS
jgi:hypothetical protein